MAEGDATPDRYEARVTQAIDHLRGNIKWTLVAFGAIGTTLLAGSQLSNLGQFAYDNPRLWLAMACALLALSAATFAVYSTLKVAYTGYTDFYHLGPSDTAHVEENPALLEGFANVAALRQAYDVCKDDRHKALTATQKNMAAIQSFETWFAYLDGLVDHVVSYVRYNRIRLEAERTRKHLIVASIIAAISLVVFAWAANPGKSPSTIVLQSPAAKARLTLTEAGKTTLQPLLGAACVSRTQIDVILLNVTAANFEVVTLESDGCPIARFNVTGEIGRLSRS